MFVMRPSNDRDQALIRSAISDAGASMLTFVPSLSTGEVFAFGAGVPLPTRMKFCELPAALRPTREAGGNTRVAAGALPDRNMIDSVIDRWHASTMSKGQINDGGESWRDDPALAREEIPRYQAASPMQPAMFSPHRHLPLPPSRRPRPQSSRRSRRGRASCASAVVGTARTEQSGAAAQPLSVDLHAHYARAPKIALPTRTCVAPIVMAVA